MDFRTEINEAIDEALNDFEITVEPPKPSMKTAEDRAFWSFVQATAKTVKRWPKWKRISITITAGVCLLLSACYPDAKDKTEGPKVCERVIGNSGIYVCRFRDLECVVYGRGGIWCREMYQ